MGMRRNFNSIFALLGAQMLILLIFGSIGPLFDEFAPWPHYRSDGLAAYLLMVSGLLALLTLAWFALLESVDIYWGLSAKLRIRRWMIPALASVTALVLCTSGLIFETGREHLFGVDMFMMADASVVVPLAVTALLIVSAARRWQAIGNGLSEMRNALQALSPKVLDRVATSIDDEAGTAGHSVRSNPRGFAFAGLTSKPWHDPADFPWLNGFVESIGDIRDEAEAVLKGHHDRVEHYHYVGLDGDFWTNFSFVRRHEEIPENLELCPTVAALLKTVPGYPAFRDAMFSILGPNGHIKPHRDVSNVFLTLHLPLVVDGNGYIEVGGIRRHWRYGEPLVFDSSYAHEAANLGDNPRIVLLLDFPHPDLTPDEVAWIRASRI
jgi:beta-hydroxylase